MQFSWEIKFSKEICFASDWWFQFQFGNLKQREILKIISCNFVHPKWSFDFLTFWRSKHFLKWQNISSKLHTKIDEIVTAGWVSSAILVSHTLHVSSYDHAMSRLSIWTKYCQLAKTKRISLSIFSSLIKCTRNVFFCLGEKLNCSEDRVDLCPSDLSSRYGWSYPIFLT